MCSPNTVKICSVLLLELVFVSERLLAQGQKCLLRRARGMSAADRAAAEKTLMTDADFGDISKAVASITNMAQGLTVRAEVFALFVTDLYK